MPKAARSHRPGTRELRCVAAEPVFGVFERTDTGERVCGGTPAYHPDQSHTPVFEYNSFVPVPLLSDAEALEALQAQALSSCPSVLLS